MIIGTLLTVLLVLIPWLLIVCRPRNRVHAAVQNAAAVTLALGLWASVGVFVAIWIWYLASIFLPVPALPT